jgi:Putative Actinobacterial Holin-X, holin superfamily III
MPFDGLRNSALVRTLADVLDDLPDLFRKEIRFAQAEFTGKIRDGVQGSAWMIVAALLGIVTFFILLQAAIFAIASLGLALHWACLIIAAVVGGCAVAAFLYGRSTLPNTLVPTRSVNQVNEDVRTVKEQLT